MENYLRKNMVDMPPKYSQWINEHFWELLGETDDESLTRATIKPKQYK